MSNTADHQHLPVRRSAGTRLFDFLSLACVALLATNVLVGKAAVSLGWQPPFHLGDIAEFLLLVAAVVFFVITTLKREARRPPPGPPNDLP